MDCFELAHFGLEHQLADHENRGHGVSAADLPRAVNVAGHASAGFGFGGAAGAVSHGSASCADLSAKRTDGSTFGRKTTCHKDGSNLSACEQAPARE